MINCARYQIKSPYPKVDKAQANPGEIRMLLSDYTGARGELTAINQYLYSSLMASDQKFPEVAETFECVSITEMHHYRLLGGAIIAIGGDPKIYSFPKRSNMPTWWSGNFVTYRKNITEMLTVAIKSEEEAIAAYKQNIQRMQNEQIISLINRIIMDEENHVEIFSALLAKCNH